MKRGTIRHPKLLRLARELDCAPYCALGLLEALLDWAYTFAPRGDVGRFTDADIAEAVGWRGDPRALCRALVVARWLDPCRQHRLVIHDLADHADRTWKQRMRRYRHKFVRPQCGVTEASLKPQCVLLPEPEPEPEPEPVPQPELLSLASLARVPALGFDEFWQRYPLHVGKQAAQKAWAKLGPSPPLGAIVDALTWQRELPRWQEERGRYVPHPATYLNGRRWEDERPPPGPLELLNLELAEKA